MTERRIRLPAHLPQGPLRSRARAREALPRREPPRRRCAAASSCRRLGRARRAASGRCRDPTLERAVVEAMTTNETFFFRDKRPFDLFRDVLLPRCLAARRAARRLRIWCAAASTGQEPYSLAMILQRRRRRSSPAGTVEIVAHRHLRRGARAGAERPLQPVRGAARPADPASPEALHPDRRPVAGRAGASAPWSSSGRSTCSRISPSSAPSTSSSAATC